MLINMQKNDVCHLNVTLLFCHKCTTLIILMTQTEALSDVEPGLHFFVNIVIMH